MAVVFHEARKSLRTTPVVNGGFDDIPARGMKREELRLFVAGFSVCALGMKTLQRDSAIGDQSGDRVFE